MKTALVTGASSGIGLELCQHLLKAGWRVYGIARSIENIAIEQDHFTPLACDITDTKQLQSVTEGVFSEKAQSLDLLINNAGMGRFAPHEEIALEDIERMVKTNLLAPLILTQLFLRVLKKSQGRIINISSITAEHLGKRGAAYAATKAGLLHFSKNLFEEVRKSGVSVSSILPDLTDTPFYDALDFEPEKKPDTCLKSSQVAEAVLYLLSQPQGSVVEQITLRPQFLRIRKKGYTEE